MADNYQMEEVRAKEIIQTVRRCQIDETVFPPSLLDIWTPVGWSASEEEQRLRVKAMQLFQGRPMEEDIEESIMTVTNMLLEEGLFEELLSGNVNSRLINIDKIFSFNSDMLVTAIVNS